VRSLLGRLGLRGGLVIGLAVLVLAIVAVARFAARGTETPSYTADVPATSTVNPTAGDDSEVASATAYPDDAAVKAAADKFTTAWLKRALSPAEWLAGLAPLSTETLAKSFEGVDPKVVPATRVVAAPTIVLRTDSFAQTSTLVDTGTLVLGLSRHDGRWLIDSVDWDRA
jgi:hypothetical protein